MRLWLLLLLLAGCGLSEDVNMRACKDACAPYGVKKYSDDGCECNKCPGGKIPEIQDDDTE